MQLAIYFGILIDTVLSCKFYSLVSDTQNVENLKRVCLISGVERKLFGAVKSSLRRAVPTRLPTRASTRAARYQVSATR